MKRGALANKLYYEEPLSAAPPVVRKARQGWRQVARVGTYSIVTFTLMVIAYLCLCTRIVQEQYEVDHYQSMIPPLAEENTNLDIQVRTLGSLDRIDMIARKDLHMGYPKERLIIQDDSESVAKSNNYYAWRVGKKIAWP